MKKDYLTITKKHRMENSQDRNGKNKSYISTKNITELNKLIYAGAKLVCKKIGVLLKSMNKKKSKSGWEIRSETQIRNLRKQAKMIKRRGKNDIISSQ